MAAAGWLLAAGCVGTGWPRGTWEKPGVSPEERLRDEYECERHATMVRAGEAAPEQRYGECMKARGYRRVR